MVGSYHELLGGLVVTRYLLGTLYGSSGATVSLLSITGYLRSRRDAALRAALMAVVVFLTANDIYELRSGRP